jgi:type IV secretory pathway VirB2 component (pilin)
MQQIIDGMRYVSGCEDLTSLSEFAAVCGPMVSPWGYPIERFVNFVTGPFGVFLAVCLAMWVLLRLGRSLLQLGRYLLSH